MSISRRTFIRVVGGVSLSSAVPMSYVFGNAKSASEDSGILLEASSFSNLGGWKLDTQHYQQMGGCYLLAHGMGEPVANAVTSVTIPRPGKWNVWVRTRDWCPGDWQSPGRFKLLVDGKPLEPEFGVENEDWHWQKGDALEISTSGETFNADATINDTAALNVRTPLQGGIGVKIKVELKDLTGFDGR